MIKLRKLKNNPLTALKQIGWDWMLGEDTIPYLTDEVVEIEEGEADEYFIAANELYEMFINAGQYVIDNNKFEELGIPENLIDLVKYSWENDKTWHLYGRFDLSGGTDGKPIKLIEFNADTATCIPETAVVQYAHLKANELEEQFQFNGVFEAFVKQFKCIKAENGGFSPTLLISTLCDAPEDEANVSVIGEAAREAGFEVDFEYIDAVEFSETDGIFKQNPQNGNFIRYDFWFKLVPWEYIGWEEPELAAILTKIVMNQKAVVMNPAYSLLFQSKAMLKVLWELNPYHPLLLKTDNKPLPESVSVEKVLFGREGANVRVIEKSGEIAEAAGGEYEGQRVIFQEFTPFLRDEEDHYYQAGVFFAGEACGLGFRRGGKIIDNRAQFCGHILY